MPLTKRLNASGFLLDFLIWSILSLFGTRLFLHLFNYPIIGRGIWHISHVLWGGLLMLVGIIILLIFYGKSSIKSASIIAGIGWGLFIDEIGKYLTQDYDYWFRPAIAFIYISFILLFFLYRLLEKESTPSRVLLWHELLEDCQELINQDLEVGEKKELLQKIKVIQKYSSSPQEKKILTNLKILINSTVAKKDKYKFNLSKLIATSLKLTYTRLFKKKLVFYSLFIYSLLYIGDKFVYLVKLLLNHDKVLLLKDYYSHYDFFSRSDVFMITSKFFIEIIVTIFFAIGFFFFTKKRSIRGIKFYQWGMLINIFLAAPIKFYFEQLNGVFSLILSIIIFSWLRDFRREKILKL